MHDELFEIHNIRYYSDQRRVLLHYARRNGKVCLMNALQNDMKDRGRCIIALVTPSQRAYIIEVRKTAYLMFKIFAHRSAEDLCDLSVDNSEGPKHQDLCTVISDETSMCHRHRVRNLDCKLKDGMQIINIFKKNVRMFAVGMQQFISVIPPRLRLRAASDFIKSFFYIIASRQFQ